ncbi:hypothetical protein VHEMI08847 [[Torrubiella] hemipterigena]|nr:hypothetical protein VHEMI08847 [[Torrubiella] hemipterigena]
MQVLKSKSSMVSTMYRFASRDGIASLWAGLSASLLRQSTYSTARFGFHNYLSSLALRKSGKEKLPASWNVACAGVSGGVAGLIGNPTEVALVRMCADGAKKPSERFNYSNSIQALFRVCKEEGFSAFTKGLMPNVVRSVLMNISQIATYASAKQWVLASVRSNDDITTHSIASFIAGTVATTLCAPADIIKSRMQATAGKEGIVQVVRQGIQHEGPLFLMKGWTPAFIRITPHTILTFVFMEQLKKVVQFSVTPTVPATVKL